MRHVRDYEYYFFILALFDSLKKTLWNSWMKCMNIRPERFLVGTGNQTIQDMWIRLENLFQNFCPICNYGLILRFTFAVVRSVLVHERRGHRRDNIDIKPKVISPPRLKLLKLFLEMYPVLPLIMLSRALLGYFPGA